ncbi:hypothetical protein ACFQ3J_08905 [Paenibacillus provencensis]|uniref:Uncharacterized protein n=1 Tax=Paenibacillus provencensis TaxID=441151 RepID=A0ABW3PS26_9BACL|nr:hypothetical protein [Paenibacillus sp. MER 78]MCM3128990.1 hypothetical protein [Paenibacillus sp. MER 78]
MEYSEEQLYACLSNLLAEHPLRPDSEFEGMFHNLGFKWDGDPVELMEPAMLIVKQNADEQLFREFSAQLIYRYTIRSETGSQQDHNIRLKQFYETIFGSYEPLEIQKE